MLISCAVYLALRCRAWSLAVGMHVRCLTNRPGGHQAAYNQHPSILRHLGNLQAHHR